MTSNELLSASRQAIAHMNERNFGESAKCWETILKEVPNWEHGTGAYNLAVCYEELKRFDDAFRLYRRAVSQEPENEIFIGGYASFLYLHGDAKEAFDLFGQMFRKAIAKKDISRTENIATAMIELGTKLGLSEAEVRERLK